MEVKTTSVLEKDFPYYSKLSKGEKDRFEKRVHEFRKDRTFEGRKDFQITEKIEILIAAAAVQLTFGHVYYFFEHFKRIIVYPEKYYSKYDQKYHLGEAHSMGVIVLSWKDFYEGIKIDSDAKNVGLHEFAHALFLSEVLGRFKDDYFSDYVEKWIAFGRLYLAKTRESDTYFFRKYATTNIQELFAVGIEYFFERPEDFYKNEPDFYRIYSLLLRQDPRLPDNEFSYQKMFHGIDCDFLEIRAKAQRQRPVSPNAYILMFMMIIFGLMFLMFPVSFWTKILIWAPIAFYSLSILNRKLGHENYVIVYTEALIRIIHQEAYPSPMWDLIISLDYFQYEDEDGRKHESIKIIYADFDGIASTSIDFVGNPEGLFRSAYYNYKIAVFKYGKKYIPALPESINKNKSGSEE